MIKTEQDIPLSRASTLQTEMKDLSSHNQHKHFWSTQESYLYFNTSHPWYFSLQQWIAYLLSQNTDLLCNLTDVLSMKPYQNLNSK